LIVAAPQLLDILVITIYAVLYGVDGWVETELWAKPT
jgi:hypothetical protein